MHQIRIVYVVLVNHEDDTNTFEAFGEFHHFDDAKEWADTYATNNQPLVCIVLPVKPAE